MLARLFLIIAIIGFCFSVVAHVLTFFVEAMAQMSHVWPLHLGIFVVFIPMVVMQQRWSTQITSDAAQFATPRNQRPITVNSFQFVPRWIKALLGLCFAYAILNFILFAGTDIVRERREGKISERDGRHVLVKNREVVREVTDAEYQENQLRIARGFSGHWMLFYGVAAVGLYDVIQRKRAVAELAPAGAMADPSSFGWTGQSPRLSLQAHSILSGLAGGIGFFAGPVITVLIFLPAFRSKSGWACVFVPIFFGSAIVGVAITSIWFKSRVAARCPSCGGRAFGNDVGVNRRSHWIYHCRDCGAEHHVQ
jgi:hypothetical protein